MEASLLKSYFNLNSRLKNSFCFTFFFFCLGVADHVLAQSFLFPGASTTFESGLSQTNTRGSVALASNPGNALLTKRIEAYADLTIVNFSYTYQMPGRAPAKIALTAPPVNFGAMFKPKSNIAFGFFFTPRPGMDALKIKGIPFDMDQVVLPVDIEQKSSTFLTALGGGVKVNKSTSFGLAFLENAEDSQIIVRREGTNSDEDALVGMRYRGISTQVLLGFRHVPNSKTILGGSIKTPVTRAYKGSEIIQGDKDNSIRKKTYSPAVLALGSEYKLGAPIAFGEIRYEAWSQGKDKNSSGLPGATKRTALNDLFILVAGGRLRMPGGHSGSVSIGIYPRNVGLGSTKEDISSPEGASGVGFGEFDALDRTMFSAAYRLTRKKMDLMAGFNVINGTRSVPEDYPGSGKYTLTVFSIGGGGRYYF